MKTNIKQTKIIYRMAIMLGLAIGLCACSSNKMSNIGCGYGYEENVSGEVYCQPESEKNYEVIKTSN